MLRCSAVSAEPCCLTTAAIRAVSTCRPSSSSAVWEAAVRVCRESAASADHSVCQLPSGRSSTVAAAARCSWAASPGEASAARRISTESTGFAFCGIVEEPPRPSAGGLGQLADLGSREQQYVVRDVAHRIGGADQRVGVPRERSARGVPGRRVVEAKCPRGLGHQELGGIRVAGQLDDRREGPGGTADLDREAQRPQVVARVEHALEPLGRLQAEGDRHGVLGQGAPGHHVVAVPARQACECGGRRYRGPGPRPRHVARAQRTSAVSSTSWLVSPRCSQVAASELVGARRSRSNDTRGTTGLPLASAAEATCSRSRASDQAVQVGARTGRGHSGLDQ